MIMLNFPNPVEREQDFYGRQAELSLIERTLLSGRGVPVIIKGERHIGKTSLQNIAIQRLKRASKRKVTPLIVEPRGIATLDAFVEAILLRLASFTDTDIRQCGLVDPAGRVHLDAINQFGAAFTRLSGDSQDALFVICVDEFDQILRNAGQEVLRFDALMHFLIRESNLPVVVLLSMTHFPDELKQAASSPFTSEAEILRLQPFTLTEMEAMVTGLLGTSIVIPPTELAWLNRMSGGHPYFAKLLLANLQDQMDGSISGSPTQELPWDAALMRAVSDVKAENALENIYRVWFNDYEKRVVLLLAGRRNTLGIRELNDYGKRYLTAARSLAQRGYLQEQQAGYAFRIGFIGHWLRHWIQYDEEMERLRVPRLTDPWSSNQPIILTSEDLHRFGREHHN